MQRWISKRRTPSCASALVRIAAAGPLLAVGATTLAGCASLAGGPRGFSVEETRFGLYARDGEGWQLVESTTRVPCREGVAFGLQAELVSRADREAKMPVQGAKFEAMAPGEQETRVLFLTEVLVAPVGEARRPIDAIFPLEAPTGGALFDHPVLIRLFDPVSGHTYLERSFEIEGCAPAGASPREDGGS